MKKGIFLMALLCFLQLSSTWAQYKFKTIAEDKNLKVQLRYKIKIAFNEGDKDLFSFVLTNKSSSSLKINGVSWNLDGKDYNKYKDYVMFNTYDFMYVQKREKSYIDTTLNYLISPKAKLISEKLEERIFYFTQKDKIKATSRLGLHYQIDSQDFQLIDTVKNIKFELIAFDNYTHRQMADSINNYLWNGKKDFATKSFLTYNPKVWDYINVPKFIAYLCSDTIDPTKKCHLLPVVKAIPAKYNQEKQVFHRWIIGNIYLKKESVFHELEDYWDDEFLIPIVEVFERSDEDLYCYAHIILKQRSNNTRIDSSLDFRLYVALNKKKETFFAKYATKKDSLGHINEWMQILNITKSKYLIPYLKCFLGDTSKVLDADYITGTYDRYHYCLYRKEPQMYMISHMFCHPEPLTVEQFALDAIYKLTEKEYCNEVKDAVVEVFYKDKVEDCKKELEIERSEKLEWINQIKDKAYYERKLFEFNKDIQASAHYKIYDEFEKNINWQLKREMIAKAAHHLAIEMLKE